MCKVQHFSKKVEYLTRLVRKELGQSVGARFRTRQVFDRYQIHRRLLLPCTMAINDESANSQNVAAALVVEMGENNIPGGPLSAPLESHTVPELTWWLLCPRIKYFSSQKKAQLIGRYTWRYPLRRGTFSKLSIHYRSDARYTRFKYVRFQHLKRSPPALNAFVYSDKHLRLQR